MRAGTVGKECLRSDVVCIATAHEPLGSVAPVQVIEYSYFSRFGGESKRTREFKNDAATLSACQFLTGAKKRPLGIHRRPLLQNAIFRISAFF
jgi:hypothetical protein